MRQAVEVVAAAVGGLLALASPVLTGASSRFNEAAFLPFIGDVVETVNGFALLLLFSVGIGAGRVGTAPPGILGIATVIFLPVWSAIDVAMGGQGHNLLPFEWLIYGFYGLVGTAGAIVGRNRGFRKRGANGTAG